MVRSTTLTPLQTDQRQSMAWIPRAGGELGRDREWRLTCWLWIVESEVVDELLDAHRAWRRQSSIVEEPPDVGVRRRVDIDRERRERVCVDATKAVLLDGVVGLGVERANVSERGSDDWVANGAAGKPPTTPPTTLPRTPPATPSGIPAMPCLVVRASMTGVWAATAIVSRRAATDNSIVMRRRPPAVTATGRRIDLNPDMANSTS